EELHYMYQGSHLPCMEGCPEVLDLPQLSVATYIEGQATKRFEVAQDDYLELMQNLADIAFALLLESGLAESGDRQTLCLWREMGSEEPEQLQDRLGPEWIDLLMLPELTDGLNDPIAFSRQHNDLLLLKAQEAFSTLDNLTDFCKASELLMGLALHLGRGLGANPTELVEHWIKTAKGYGALD
ncbi:MAG: YkgJ family cysteine cluster protein, partial [Proteobacteria bacterium]|nr:YkgJ family cysteine cluster protein [Pseudomonadota bacterium]